MDIHALFDQYKTAHAADDQAACNRIIDSVPHAQLDEFTRLLESANFEGAEVPSPKVERMNQALLRSGMGAPEASALSILSGGSFTEFVRERARTRGYKADTMLAHALESQQHDLDDADEAAVRSWLDQVLSGKDEPDLDLPDGAEVLLARALGSTEQTILAVRERS